MVVVYLFVFLVTVLPPPPSLFEVLCLSVHLNTFKFYLCLLYCPPSSPSTIFDEICTYFQFIDVGCCLILFFLGDFNVNYDNPTHPLYTSLCNLVSLYSLTNIYIGPTHVYHDGSTSTIDLVFTSSPSIVSNSETVPPLANSDHTQFVFSIT